MVAQVVIQSDTRALDRCFSYVVPETMAEQICVGMQVSVPFGAGNRLKTGVVLSLSERETDEVLKPIRAIETDAMICPDYLLPLIEYLRESTFCSYQDALRVLLPPGSRQSVTEYLALVSDVSDEALERAIGRSGICQRIVDVLRENDSIEYEKLCSALARGSLRVQVEKLKSAGVLTVTSKETTSVHEKTERVVVLSMAKELVLSRLEESRAAPAQEKQLRYIMENAPVPVSRLLDETKTTHASLNGLVKKGLVQVEKRPVSRVPEALLGHARTKAFTPNAEQEKAIDALKQAIISSSFSKTLLYGVTGSGKTEVFLQAIEQIIALKKQAIVLVPEISLTPQMVERFVGRFGNRVAVLHSVLSAGERYDQWKKIAQGEVDVVVGARSAVFAPCKNLGIIVIDEEHEPSYKSENAPRYHAREVAFFRGQQQSCPVLLSSATPSIETFYSAQEGDCRLLTLTTRSNAAAMPDITVVDMRRELMEGNRSVLSRTLSDALGVTQQENKQSILFLNKRGYASFVSCRSCGETIKCPNCSVSLTYHSARNRMVCHYCDFQCPPPKECPECHSPYIRPFGIGTQKVEGYVKETFPTLKTARMDADTTGGKLAHRRILSSFSNQEVNVLIGTQMIAKGLDFPNVTLVGVLAADLSLHIDDYRSRERTFQILTQVCGRSGRGKSAGRAIIQTYSPEDETIGFVQNQDYLGFYQSELALRRMLSLPPFAHFVLIQITSDDEKKGRVTLNKWKAALEIVQRRGELSEKGCQILSCGDSPISRIGRKHRFRILLKTQELAETRCVLHRLYQAFLMKKPPAGQTVTIDCNPNSIL